MMHIVWTKPLLLTLCANKAHNILLEVDTFSSLLIEKISTFMHNIAHCI